MTTRPLSFSVRASIGAAFGAYRAQPASHLAGWLAYGAAVFTLESLQALPALGEGLLFVAATFGFEFLTSLLAFGPTAYCLAVHRRRKLSRKIFQPARAQVTAFIIGSLLMAAVLTVTSLWNSLLSFAMLISFMIYSIFWFTAILDRKVDFQAALVTSQQLVRWNAGKVLLLILAILVPMIGLELLKGMAGLNNFAVSALVAAIVAHWNFHLTTHAYTSLVPPKPRRKKPTPAVAA